MELNFSLLKKIAEEEPKPPCKGLFFRGSVSVYHDGKGRITEKKEIRLLKRKSCEGCDECFGFWEYLSDCDLTDYEDGGRRRVGMTREEFRNTVYSRDNHTCVVPNCGLPAVDAHHLIERALWTDKSEFGGYIPDNGVSVCEIHHKHAEKNFFPPQALRDWAGIENRILPKGFDPNNWYTKWGDELKHPTRELCKYPSTMYLPFSPEYDVSKRGLIEIETLLHKPLVMTLKMDGSNCCLRHDKVVARNGDTAEHPSFDMIKGIHAGLKSMIPEHIQIFGEWIYAKHSIHYTDLEAYFQVFAIYDSAKELWLSWDDTEMWAEMLGFITVPVIAKREGFDADYTFTQYVYHGATHWINNGHEGIVVRNAYPFHYGQFEDNVAKYVRANHVQTNKHWSTQQIIKNEVV